MTDERRTRRARSVMGDDDRALVGRERRVPVHIDPEATPPPQEPPKPETIEGYDSIPPPIKAQLAMLRDSVSETTAAIERVWGVRDVGPQIEKLEAEVAGYRRDIIESSAQLREFVMPAIKSLMARVETVTSTVERDRGRTGQFWDHDWPRIMAGIEKLDKRLDDLADRITRLEHSSDRMNQSVGGIAARVTSVEAINNALDVRITALERRNADQDAGDRRQAKLLSWGRAGILALVALISFLASHCGSVVESLAK